MKKTIDAVFVILSLILIIMPVAFFNMEDGMMSETEKRYLAGLPTAEFGTNEWKTQFENWLNDNIGFRDKLIDIRTTIMFKGLNIMTTEKVQKGKNGFYFYTLNNNIEIAKGTYPLNEDKLKEIANAQQTISDYYRATGREYVLVLTPSKVSIYPEYLYGNYSVRETPVDIIYDYLKQNTDVIVINTKDKLLENKDKGQLFWKTDTHWTALGAYYAYLAIVEGMNEAGITDIIPVDVDIVDARHNGDLSAMIGKENILGTETADGIAFNETSQITSEGEFCDKLNELCRENGVGESVSYNVQMLSNDNNHDMPSLLMYTDSQFMLVRKIPNLLSESFSQIIQTRARTVIPEMDDITDADIVIFSCSERNTNSLLTNVPKNAVFSERILEDINNIVPETIMPLHKKGYGGMYMDYINNIHQRSKEFVQGSIPRKIYEERSTVTFSGWSADFTAGKPLSKLYMKVGERTVECEYGTKRSDVADHFDNQDLTMTGFTVTVPKYYLDEADKIEFIQVGNDGTYRFETVDYILTD
ncbi:MAG: DHHW family protein [Ruminococcus sp.]|nr:DHHW family protein [Ruminococcus sp.]